MPRYMGLTKPIPKKLREDMAEDPYYERCCVTNEPKWRVKVEWHHNLSSYLNGNKGRVNEKWCILPLADWVHRMADRREIKELLDWIMLQRATDTELERWSIYPGELKIKRNHLNTKYANQENRSVLPPHPSGNIPSIGF